MQLKNAIDHRMLGAVVLNSRARKKKDRATDKGRLALHLRDESLDVELRLGAISRIEEAVENNERGAVTLGLLAQQVDTASSPSFFKVWKTLR